MATNKKQFSIETFKSALIAGGARPNQFEVTITYPTEFPAPTIPSERGSFLITAAELPGSTQGVAPIYYRGRLVKLAGDKEFAPFNMTIINDSSFTIRKSLETWMSLIENRSGKRGYTNPAFYMGTITVSQLDRNGGVLRQYKIIDAFPVEIGPVQLDFGTNDQISTFGATFQYQTFDVTDGQPNAVPLAVSDFVQNVR